MVNKKSLLNTGGYLLVEIIVSQVLLILLIGIGSSILTLSNTSRSRAENFNEANSVIFAKLQEYELKQYENIPTGTSAINNYQVEDFSAEVEAMPTNKFNSVDATVHSQSLSASLKKVWLNMYYEFGDEGFNVDYATYIQIGGVGR